MCARIAMLLALGLVLDGAQPPGLANDRQQECIPSFDHSHQTYCEFVPVGPVVFVVGDSRAAAMVSFGSEFFTSLQRRINNAQKPEFIKAGKVVEKYPNELNITIEPLVFDQSLKQTESEQLPKPAVKLVPELRPCRVIVQWLDESQHPALEQSTELQEIEEAWPELRQPRVWYQGTISGVNQSLTTAFQIKVFGKGGKLLGMLRGAALTVMPPPKP
jgi:hypothetical protein